MTEQWIAGLVLAVVVSGVALRVRSLSRSGAVAATLLGTVVVGTGGWWPGIILVVFFTTSSMISKLNRSTCIEQAKGSQRDWVQVLANGWGLLVGCVLFAITDWQPWLLFGFGAIAAATADTWSSEIGRTSAIPPRLITTWQTSPRGTSGAVSARGLIASVAGAAVIALAVLMGQMNSDLLESLSFLQAIVGVVFAGIIGGLLDSVLGATVQEQRHCSVCNVRTEENPHSCGSETRIVSGIRGFNNDVVNFLCVAAGALIGLISGIL